MKAEDYEYQSPEDDYEISEERKEKLIEKIEKKVSKGFIAHRRVLKIGKNAEELDFLYHWLDNHNIEIRGINGTITGEIPNYTHIIRLGKDYTQENLSEEEEEKLFLKLNEFSKEDKERGIPEYLDIRDKLIKNNMKLADWITSWSGIMQFPIEKEDKEQMAYIGLMNAVDTYKPGIAKFSTYAIKVIYRRIQSEVYREDGELYQSKVTNKQLAMIPDIEETIFVTTGVKAKPCEIADILGISLKRLEELQTLIKLKERESLEQVDSNIRDEEKFINGLSDSDKVTKINDKIFVQDGVYIDEEDILPQGFTIEDRVNDKTMRKMLEEEIQKSLLELKEREAEILRLRFGLANEEMPKTLDEVGKEFGLTRERVRQIEAKALRRLRCTSRAKYLKEFLEEDNGRT